MQAEKLKLNSNTYICRIEQVGDNYIKVLSEQIGQYFTISNYRKKISKSKIENLKKGSLLPVIVNKDKEIKISFSKQSHKEMQNYNQWLKFFTYLSQKNLILNQTQKKQIINKYQNIQSLLKTEIQQSKLKQLCSSYIQLNNIDQTVNFDLEIYQPDALTILKNVDDILAKNNIKLWKVTGKTYKLKTDNIKNALSLLYSCLNQYKHKLKICKSA